MKPVSRNISESLRGQKEAGRMAPQPTAKNLGKGTPMTVPGEGSVQDPPGKDRDGGGNNMERSAHHFADAMSTRVGGKKST